MSSEATASQARRAGSIASATRPSVTASTLTTTTTMTSATAATAAAAPDADVTTSLVTKELLALSERICAVVPQGTWVSLGSEDEVHAESDAALREQQRPLITVEYDVPRHVLLRHRALHASYVTKDASEDSRDLRATAPQPQYELTRDEVDMAVQAVPQRHTAAVQTHYTRQVNAVVQVQPTLVDACVRRSNGVSPSMTTTGMTTTATAGGSNKAIATSTGSGGGGVASLPSFLQRALPRMTHCLRQNYEVPIYVDDLALFKEDEAIVGARDDVVLQERGNYTHATIKERRVTSISWRSAHRKDDCVCVAAIAPHTLEQRIDAQRRCDGSVALVWSFSDPMHPHCILESAHEVQVLRFSPAFPHLIAGGALNGQVYLWDLSLLNRVAGTNDSSGGSSSNGAPSLSRGGRSGGVAERHGSKPAAATRSRRSTSTTRTTTAAAAAKDGQAAAEEQTAATAKDDNGQQQQEEEEAAAAAAAADVPAMPSSVKGLTLEKDGDVLVPRLQPTQVSRVELSHRRPVHDLQWLPSRLECTFEGKQTLVEASHQFVTISDDGNLFVWDIRTDYLPPDKQRKLKHQSMGGTGQDVLWVPLHRYALTRPDGNGDLMGFRCVLDGLAVDDTPLYSAVVASTQGELAYCNMVARHDRRASMLMPTFGLTKDTRFVRTTIAAAHAGPVYTVQRHPRIADVYLTCGDRCFKVWRAHVPLPLYRSPNVDSSSSVSGGAGGGGGVAGGGGGGAAGGGSSSSSAAAAAAAGSGMGVTCAAWSPTRPGIVFVGTSDGKLAVYDLLDRNHEPLLVHHIVQDAITTLAFKPLPHTMSQTFTQQLAIGTSLGSFHCYVVPAVLTWPPNGEKRHVRAMLEREARRAAYYLWRRSVREQEMHQYGAQAARMTRIAAGGGGGRGGRRSRSRGDGGSDRDGGSDADDGDATTTTTLAASAAAAAAATGGRRSKSHKRNGGAGRWDGKDDAGGGEGGENSSDGDADELVGYYAHDPQRDADFLARVAQLHAQEQESMKMEALR